MKLDIQFQPWYVRWKKSHKWLRFLKTKRGVPLNICIGKTLKKYGYHPGYLRNESGMRVVAKCVSCSKLKYGKFNVLRKFKRCCSCANASKVQKIAASKFLAKKLNLPGYILVDETIKHYGYDPRLLMPSSGRIVIFKCIKCKELRNLSFYLSNARCEKCCRRKFLKRKRKIDSCVLVDETLKRFGYDPRTLYECSKRLVVIKCISCGSFYETSLNQKRCWDCSHKENRPCGKDNYFYGRVPLHFPKSQWYTKKDGVEICFKSQWELWTAMWFDERGLHWQYEPKAFPVNYPFEVKGKWQMVAGTYRPDFFIEEWNKWIEVKGYWRDDAKAKFNAVIFQSLLDVELWDGPKLKELGIL